MTLKLTSDLFHFNKLERSVVHITTLLHVSAIFTFNSLN
ncbi:hypothetical protein PESP_b0009 [Pseudoalteromonas espejiana DSM 9414]|nr:hypothetical protein PESP_b0009 [Pseudoalteromonas espejiana DSM 9414]